MRCVTCYWLMVLCPVIFSMSFSTHSHALYYNLSLIFIINQCCEGASETTDKWLNGYYIVDYGIEGKSECLLQLD